MATPSPLFPPITGPFTIRRDTPPAYVVWFDGANYRADSMTGGADFIDSADAAAVARSALVAMPSGGLLFFKGPQTFPLKSRLAAGSNFTCIPIPDNTTVMGTGPDCILQPDANVVLGDNDVVMGNKNADVTGGNNILVTNLVMDGNKANRVASKAGLLSFNGASGAKGQNCRANNLYMRNANGNAIAYRFNKNGFISNCWCDSNGSTGIGTPSGLYLISNTQLVIENVIITNGAWRGVKIDSCNQLTFNNVQVYAMADSAFSLGDNTSNLDFVQCIAENNTGFTGLNFAGAVGTINDIRIIGGSYSNNQNGIILAGARNIVKGARIAGNTGSNSFGLWLGNTTTDSLFEGNIVQNNGSDGIRADGSGFGNIVFANNRSVGNTGNGIRFTISAPTLSILMIGNDVTGNGGSIAIDNPSAFFRTVSNPGFNPQGYATTTPAVPASGSDQQNTSGYPVTVFITGVGSGITAYGITDPLGTLTSFTTTVNVGQAFYLDVGAKIRLTYTGSPTWKWYGR